jgi:hypothetical protein
VTRTVVVAPLKPGARAQARELVESGPPFDLAETELTAHAVYLTDGEAVFVFEGPAPRREVERIVGDPGVWRSARAWQACLAGRPRLADEAFSWARDAA